MSDKFMKTAERDRTQLSSSFGSCSEIFITDFTNIFEQWVLLPYRSNVGTYSFLPKVFKAFFTCIKIWEKNGNGTVP